MFTNSLPQWLNVNYKIQKSVNRKTNIAPHSCEPRAIRITKLVDWIVRGSFSWRSSGRSTLGDSLHIEKRLRSRLSPKCEDERDQHGAKGVLPKVSLHAEQSLSLPLFIIVADAVERASTIDTRLAESEINAGSEASLFLHMYKSRIFICTMHRVIHSSPKATTANRLWFSSGVK